MPTALRPVHRWMQVCFLFPELPRMASKRNRLGEATLGSVGGRIRESNGEKCNDVIVD